MDFPTKDKTITIVVPAYNEEENLEKALDSLMNVVKNRFRNYEILIFNDNSTDKTSEIANRLALENNRIKVIHNKKNMGLGYNYMAGAQLASMEYYALFPGDNENSADSFYDVLKEIPKSEIIIPYPTNSEVRSAFRRIVSGAYTFVLNNLFDLKLNYYNGTVVYKTNLLKSLTDITYSFAYSSEILIKLLKKGNKYIEVGIKLNPIEGLKKTSAFKMKNIKMVVETVLRLFYEVNIKNRREYKYKNLQTK